MGGVRDIEIRVILIAGIAPGLVDAGCAPFNGKRAYLTVSRYGAHHHEIRLALEALRSIALCAICIHDIAPLASIVVLCEIASRALVAERGLATPIRIHTPRYVATHAIPTPESVSAEAHRAARRRQTRIAVGWARSTVSTSACYKCRIHRACVTNRR